MVSHAGLTLVLALAIGVIAQSVSRHLRVPGIVLLLLAGASLGPDGLGWISPSSLGEGLVTVVELAVAIILFEGGLNMEISRLRREQTAIRRLVTWGALVTLGGAALAAYLLMEWPLMRSLLFGGLVVVTGPTVVTPLVRQLRLRPRLATVLEAEGVLIDPVGAILAVVLLEIALQPGLDSLRDAPSVLLYGLGFGAVAGGVGGLLLGGALRIRNLVPEGYENIFTLAAVLLLFAGCNELVHHSGILAVTLAGAVVGNFRIRVDRDLREFKDQLTVMLIGLLFILLAADVGLEDVQKLGWRGVAVVAVLILVVRPLNVLLCTTGSELSARERLFAAWIAPRGIVAAAVASVTASSLATNGMEGGPELRAMVFLCIGGTVVLAGLTAAPMASLLKVRLPGRERVAILGAQGLALELAAQLRDANVPVVFVDSNPANCRLAEEAGFQVIYGDALQERTLQRARFESVGAAIGLTPNQMLNSLFATRARQYFQVPRGYLAAVNLEAGLAPELVERDEVMVVFEGPHDVERWDVRKRHGELAVTHWMFDADAVSAPEAEDDEATKPPDIGEKLVILSIRRGDKVEPMHAAWKLATGDVAAVAIHTGDEESAARALAARGFRPWKPSEALASA